jgi:hypothetical protein
MAMVYNISYAGAVTDLKMTDGSLYHHYKIAKPWRSGWHGGILLHILR